MRSAVLPASLAFALAISALTGAPARADLTPVLATELVPYATILRSFNPHLAFAQSAAYARTVLETARRFHLDPNLVVALVAVESSWLPNVSSYHGARGLGQLLPSTARDLGVSNAWLGRDNLRGTALYLHRLLGTFRGARDPVREALAGYNAGPAAVAACGAPTYETRHYVVKVMRTLDVVRQRVHRLMPNDDHVSGNAFAETAPSARQLDAALTAIDFAQTSYWGADGNAAGAVDPAPDAP